MVEQNGRISLKYTHRGYVLDTGQVVLKGTAKELDQNMKIKKAYPDLGPLPETK